MSNFTKVVLTAWLHTIFTPGMYQGRVAVIRDAARHGLPGSSDDRFTRFVTVFVDGQIPPDFMQIDPWQTKPYHL